MLILAFDTATPRVTVAVHDGKAVVAEADGEGAMAHGERLAPTIERAMRDAGASMADLTDVAVGVGPGPFTGLRVGVVTALTLASTLHIAVHGRCTLDVVADGAIATGGVAVDGEFIVATDARRKEVYWGRYAVSGGAAVRVDGPQVGRPDDVAALGLPVFGGGAALYPALLAAGGSAAEVRAAALAAAVAEERHPSLPLEPLYLRRPDAQARPPVQAQV